VADKLSDEPAQRSISSVVRVTYPGRVTRTRDLERDQTDAELVGQSSKRARDDAVTDRRRCQPPPPAASSTRATPSSAPGPS